MDKRPCFAVAFAFLLQSFGLAQTPPPATSAYVEVTATKIEEDLLAVPASITVLTAEDLERLGARDLAGALALVGGVAIGRGGDAGPASSVPEIWGLREIDAFLLVVDGVPQGGAFNPQTESLDLGDVERIEVVRGSAPVVYGSTAFSGVIQVIHRDAGAARGRAILAGGSHGGVTASVTAPLSSEQSIDATVSRERYRDDRAGADRGQLRYRLEKMVSFGKLTMSFDALRLLQDPLSPHPREGADLSDRVALDTNFNPSDAHMDDTRLALQGSLGSSIGSMPWTTTAGISWTATDIVRGFLGELDAVGENADGYSQNREITNLYLDSHLLRQITPELRLLFGVDYQGGRATADSSAFGYSVPLSGAGAPSSRDLAREEEFSLTDRRNFAAIYANSEWTPSPVWRVDGGVRFNETRESRKAGEGEDVERDRRQVSRFSGSLAVSRALAADVWLFADYRNTFKPAAIDFGPEAEPDILEPETSNSYEVGVKGRGFDERLFWQASAFLMDIENVLVSADSGSGLPGLESGGSQRFKGAETEMSLAITPGIRLSASYAHHDARFRDFIQEFDGVPTQLAGHRVEMSPRDLASLGTTFARGPWRGSAVVQYTGSRYLNKRNTALADPYATLGAGLGYGASWGELRLDGENLTNERKPVSESELGDAQYYLTPARSFRLSYSRRF